MASAVTKEEFNAFHNIDRTTFNRLVFNLRREPFESMQVMALLLCLEQTGLAHNLVYQTLQWSDTFLNSLANEAVLCLQCGESEEFPLALEGVEVPLIQTMTKGKVSLRYFYDHRLLIIPGIEKNVNEVCLRAFEDIMEQLKQRKIEETGVEDRGEQVQGRVLEGEVGDDLSPLQISSTPGHEEKEKAEIPADDRTIFLTFSKGYPISETEVKDFFTRKFGDCIDEIHMQEVPEEEQPLYARLVVQPSSSLEKILGGRSKAKFSINGKHVWGRKYVPKTQKSPSKSPPSSSSQPAPPTAS
ncbi:hypothetical protein SLEP1_g58712 [Rubroshorea leprosula]|uniref:Uncharacterized protein n=1 Tax=Rubroshorea leprosula TaxID=152421 RepID=A0AAV5MUA4_9ROSI|nr:hypothetical protein SLEP1_g58712 [Rubroshorea leprosula]